MSDIRFGTDGWRAVMCDTFIFENVARVGHAIAKYIKAEEDYKRGVVVGYDTRFFSEEFAVLCSQILVGSKIPVYLSGASIPTPVCAYAIKKKKACGGIMITASHNPPEYNGLKFIPHYAGPASPKITKAIEKELKGITKTKAEELAAKRKTWNEVKENPLVRTIDPTNEYIKQIEKLIDVKTLKKSKIKTVLDPMYGAGIEIMPAVFSKLGLKTSVIHNHRDPLFGGSMPEPDGHNLDTLRRLVLKNRAHVGLALDGDGDRFGFVDGKGVVLSPNQVLTLVAIHLIENRGLEGSLVRTVATTHALDAIAELYGLPLVETPVGFKHIANEMLKGEVLLGGEESGGLSILGHIPEKDGILADLLLAEMTAYKRKPLSIVLRDIYKKIGYFYSIRIDLKYPVDKKEKLLKRLKEKPPKRVAGLPIENINARDGVKYQLKGGGWLLVRPSGTEPLIRIYVESLSRAKFDELKKAAMRLVAK